MALLSSLLSALVMWATIWLLTRNERGRVSLRPVLWISLGSCVLSLFCLRFLGHWGLAVVLGLVLFALWHWCFLSVWRATIVAVVWLLAQIAFGIFVSPIF